MLYQVRYRNRIRVSGKKHLIAQVKAQLQAQVKVATLSRKHKNEMFK